MKRLENVALPMTGVQFSYSLENRKDWRGRENISKKALTSNGEVDTTEKVLNLASSLRQIAVDSWGEHVCDGAIAGIGEKNKLTFGIAVPMKSGSEVLLSVGGKDYEVGGREVKIYEVKNSGEKITKNELGLPEIKG